MRHSDSIEDESFVDESESSDSHSDSGSERPSKRFKESVNAEGIQGTE